MVAAVMGENLEIRREQLQLQVAQLATHLRQRLREVDRREAALNARLAQLECGATFCEKFGQIGTFFAAKWPKNRRKSGKRLHRTIGLSLRLFYFHGP